MCHINKADRKDFIALAMGGMTRQMAEEILHLFELYVPAIAKEHVDRLMHEAVLTLEARAQAEADREAEEEFMAVWWPEGTRVLSQEI